MEAKWRNKVEVHKNLKNGRLLQIEFRKLSTFT